MYTIFNIIYELYAVIRIYEIGIVSNSIIVKYYE